MYYIYNIIYIYKRHGYIPTCLKYSQDPTSPISHKKPFRKPTTPTTLLGLPDMWPGISRTGMGDTGIFDEISHGIKWIKPPEYGCV
jgi:hypothetical protein